MEDFEAVDYCSDPLESTDIWGVPGGGFMEQEVDIPRLGPDALALAKSGPLVLEAVTSPSDFIVSPGGQFTEVFQGNSFLPNDLLDSPCRWVTGNCPSNLGFSFPGFTEGLEPVEAFAQVFLDEGEGRFLQGGGVGGFSPVVDRRFPLGVAEQRGFGSP